MTDFQTHTDTDEFKAITPLHAGHGVWLVQHVPSGRICVRKEMKVYNRNVYEQLKEHPVANTPFIYEINESGGVLTVYEEYISGESMEAVLENRRVLDERLVIHYALSLCDILIALHSLRPPVIHRDIKPSNLVLTSDNRLCLLDFNAARQYDSDKSEDTELLGTKGYAAPEQYGFGESGAQADIYALGVLMREMLTGSVEAGAEPATRLGSIVKTCTRLDPSERFASAKALKQALLSLYKEPGGQNQGAKVQRAPEQGAQAKPLQGNPDGRKKKHPYALPGFRSGRILHYLIAIPSYLVILYSSLQLQIAQERIGFLWFERICVFIALLLIVLFSCNYLGIQERVRLTKIKSRALRILLVIAADCLILMLAGLFAVVAESFYDVLIAGS